ncbi:hypothetical protein HYT51_00620 [Candidatus Woesearchaeota archaeon]|nr:hypothetical protein [Candidatus Woesearchaeota archaeon]
MVNVELQYKDIGNGYSRVTWVVTGSEKERTSQGRAILNTIEAQNKRLGIKEELTTYEDDGILYITGPECPKNGYFSRDGFYTIGGPAFTESERLREIYDRNGILNYRGTDLIPNVRGMRYNDLDILAREDLGGLAGRLAANELALRRNGL